MSDIDNLNKAVKDISLNLNHCETEQDCLILRDRIEENITEITRLITNTQNITIGMKKHLEALLGALVTFKELVLHKINRPIIGAGIELQDGEDLHWRNITSAFKSRIITSLIANKGGILDVSTFLEECKKLFTVRVLEYLNPTAKINFTLAAEYIMPHRQDIDPCMKYFSTRNFEICKDSDIASDFDEVKQDILNKMEIFETNGSGWTLSKILHLGVQINKWDPLNAGTSQKSPKIKSANKHMLEWVDARRNCSGCYKNLSDIYGWKRARYLCKKTRLRCNICEKYFCKRCFKTTHEFLYPQTHVNKIQLK